jgi:hypothetical protein
MSLAEKSKIVITPNGYKVGKLYAVKPLNGSADLSVLRANTATRTNSAGASETVPVNVPIIDYVGGCPSLVVTSTDVITLTLPSDVSMVMYNNENGIATYGGVQAGAFQIPIGRYRSILFNNEPSPYNFDVDSSDWGSITNQATFESELGVVCDRFIKSGNKIQANIISNQSSLFLSQRNITNLNYITIDGVISLYLSTNQITNFNPSLPLPNSLKGLFLGGNLIVNFNPTLPLPNRLKISMPKS